MKKNLLLLMLALLLPAFMYGQEQTVSGTVLDGCPRCVYR